VKIGKDTVVALDIELSDLWGNVLERSDQPVSYLHGGYDDLLPAVEAALEGKQVGAQVDLRLEPEDAFGDYDESLLKIEERARFPDPLEVGMRFEGVPGEGTPGDAGDPVIYRVTDIAEGKVVLDGNHPYAGVAVKFACKVRNVRKATPAEIAGGAVEGPESMTLQVGK
jgi:FKBP-type peptidyl-prolyl cis-trans isomerase SlyD